MKSSRLYDVSCNPLRTYFARRFSNKSNAGSFTYTYVHSGLLLADDETCLSDTGKVINLSGANIVNRYTQSTGRLTNMITASSHCIQPAASQFF
jgi:hypothetical protein